MFNYSYSRNLDAALAIAALEHLYGISACGKARLMLLLNERKHVARARCGSGEGCRALRLLGWTETELDTLWAHDSDSEQCFVTHYGTVWS